MSIYECHRRVPGASKKEKAVLKTLKAADILRRAKKKKKPQVTKWLYEKFVQGEHQLVPEFVREQIMQILYEKSQELLAVSLEGREKLL